MRYGEKIFGLLSLLAETQDHRQKSEIPSAAFSTAILILFLSRQPSLNALDQYRGQGSWRKLLRHGMPCGDQIANVSEVLDSPWLRSVLGQMYRRLGRNKVLRAVRGHRLAVVDGHEINCSYKRSCKHCQQREITVNGEKRIQYYHRAVIFQLVGDDFRFLLDFELLRPKEDEGTAALRLIQRVLQNHPRSFDILLGDGLYPQARLFKLLRRHHKSRPSLSARVCRATFHRRQRELLLPPPSAVIRSCRALGNRVCPIFFHQRRMASAANRAVSWSMPTLTHPWLWVRSYTP